MQINLQKKKYLLLLIQIVKLPEVIIEDDGKGFPKDILDKIGEPYIRSKKKIIIINQD